MLLRVDNRSAQPAPAVIRPRFCKTVEYCTTHCLLQRLVVCTTVIGGPPAVPWSRNLVSSLQGGSQLRGRQELHVLLLFETVDWHHFSCLCIRVRVFNSPTLPVPTEQQPEHPVQRLHGSTRKPVLLQDGWLYAMGEHSQLIKLFICRFCSIFPFITTQQQIKQPLWDPATRSQAKRLRTSKPVQRSRLVMLHLLLRRSSMSQLLSQSLRPNPASPRETPS